MNVRHTILPTHRLSWRKPAWPAYIQLLKRTDWPILVGPWHGEVGFEVLYWIPFLEQLKQEGIAPERLIPISRGGASAWYGCPQGFELFAMRTPQQVRVENRVQSARTGLLKQVQVTDFDRAVLRDAADTMKLGRRYHVIHPAWMYHGLAAYWTGHRGPQWLQPRTVYNLLPAPALPAVMALPEVFVAARFYGRETWPMDKATKSATDATLLKLAEQSPVVCLESETVTDEHGDFPIPKHPNLLRLRDLTTLTPETNLAVQSAVLSKAQGFVGTYGGLAQLALRLGKPSVTFFHQWGGTAVTHRILSDVLSLQFNVAFHTVKLGEIPMLLSVMPNAEVRQIGKQLDTRAPITVEGLTVGVS